MYVLRNYEGCLATCLHLVLEHANVPNNHRHVFKDILIHVCICVYVTFMGHAYTCTSVAPQDLSSIQSSDGGSKAKDEYGGLQDGSNEQGLGSASPSDGLGFRV